MNSNHLQQCLSGFKTVAVIGGPLVVRVHEALDASYQGNKHRYFISVDFRFRESDAMNIGKLGWLGCTKSEATRDANALSAKLCSLHSALQAARALPTTPNNLFTVKRQQEAFDRVTSRYTAEFI